MTPARRYSPVEWCGLAVAAVVTALGVTMMIAWEFELVGLLKLVPSGPAIRFNTAVLVVMSGLMWACNIFDYRRTADGLAATAACVAVLCIAKHFNLVDLDLENLLHRPSESLIARVGVGKMAIGTSVTILMLSLAVLAQHRLRHGALVSLLLGVVVCVISSVSLSRYLMGNGAMMGWPLTAGIAFLTASAIFLMGAVAIGLSCRACQSDRATPWLSYSLAFAMAAFSFLIWRELIDNETMHLKRETTAAAAGIRLQLHERIRSRLKAVERFSQRWGSLDRSSQAKDARRLLEDFEGILALNWITDDRHVGWICSLENRNDLVGKPLPPGPRHVAVDRARETGKFVFTPVLELLHGESGFVGYIPTFNEQGTITGFSAAVFRVGMTFNGIASDRRQSGFEFSVSEHGRRIYASTSQPVEDEALVAGTKFFFRGLDWQLQVWPTPATVEAYYTQAPNLVLGNGLLSALLLGGAIQLRQRAVQRSAEAQRNEMALRDSEQRFDLAVSASQDGIWEWRLGTDGFYASPRYREMLGYPPDDRLLSYQIWFTRVSPDDISRVQRAISDHFQRGVPYDVVVRFLTFRDEWIWLRVRGLGAWDNNGQPVRMAGSITDITEEREAQRQLLQHVETIAASNKALAELAEAAEAAAEAKATFLRNMSHELRTPLNSIIGFSTGLLRHVASHNLDDHQRDRIERIAASGRHLLGLVNNVLDIAKAEASEQSHQPESFELRMLIDEVTAMTEPLLQKKTAVKLAVQIASDAPTPVLDRAKLKQILLNLLSNAAKFTDRGSIDLSVDFTPDGWRFAVADTGIGISADDRLRVFENFEQVHSPGRSVEGTGLGLSICATLAQAMGGQIALVSRPGAGSTFTLLIPQGVKIPNTEENTTPQPNDEPAKVFAVDESVSPPIWLIPAKTNLPASSAPPEFPAASV